MKPSSYTILSLSWATILVSCTNPDAGTAQPTHDSIRGIENDTIISMKLDTLTTPYSEDTAKEAAITQSDPWPPSVREKYKRLREKEDKARPPIHRQGDKYTDPLTPTERAFMDSIRQQKRK